MKKDKLTCDIILDLLPSYVDGLTREETTEAVKEHLEECTDCKKSYDGMKEPSPYAGTIEEKKEIDFLKKAKKKHIAIIIVSIIAALFLGVVLFFVSAFCGNPVSQFLAERAAKKYVEENYSDLDVYVESVGYNFKFAQYDAFVKSESSPDTYFTVDISMTGEVERDSYDNVLSGWNTYTRIDSEYRKYSDRVLDRHELTGKGGFAFGSIEVNEEELYAYQPYRFGIHIDELELDKVYDINKLGSEAGMITFYAESEEVTVEKAAEYLLQIKKELDDAGVTFYAIDFTLQSPKPDDYEYDPANPEQDIYCCLLASDIYEEGMEDRVRASYENMDDFYERMDAATKRMQQ